MITEKTTWLGKCAGTTKAGAPCRRYIVFANGRCKQHGGCNSPDLIRESFEREKERLRRQFARSDRRTARLLKLIEKAKCATAEKN